MVSSSSPTVLRARGPSFVRYEAPAAPDRWELPEDTVPESAPHDDRVELLRRLIEAFVERSGRNAAVYRNLAVRFEKARPRIGFDPDLCVVEPAPPEGRELDSLLLWRDVHPPPRLAIEVVSRNHPYKDYAETPDKAAACGIEELVVFDPLLRGPRSGGGPHKLQVWRRGADATLTRCYAGDGPAFSEVLGAWLHLEQGRLLRIAEDEASAHPWLTGEEAARRDADDARRDADDARRAAERARQRILELEALLKKGSGA
jgi:Uma2 family endonuclease